MKNTISGFLILLEAILYGIIVAILGPFAWLEGKCNTKSLATYGIACTIVIHVVVVAKLRMWGTEDSDKALMADILKAQYRETLGGLLDEKDLGKLFDFIGI